MKPQPGLSYLSNPSYPILYEYTRELTERFIDGEIAIYKTHPETIFDPESFHSSFFNFNLHLLHIDTVMKQAEVIFCPSDTRKKDHEQFARVERLYSIITCACGREFVDQLTENTIASLNIGDTSISKKVSEFIKKHPTIILSLIGGSYFGDKQIDYIRKRDPGSRKSNISDASRRLMLG